MFLGIWRDYFEYSLECFGCDVSYLQNNSKYTFAFAQTSGLKLKLIRLKIEKTGIF